MSEKPSPTKSEGKVDGEIAALVRRRSGDGSGMKLEMRAERGVLWVVATGRFTLESAQRTFVEMLQAVASHGVAKVHLDGREVVGSPGTIERFLYGEFAAQTVAAYADRGVPPTTQFAYVLKPPVLDPERFGETVAVNRGMNVKAFEHPEEGLRWLTSEAHEPGAIHVAKEKPRWPRT